MKSSFWPENRETLKKLAENHSEDTFEVFFSLPGTFLIDGNDAEKIALSEKSNTEKIIFPKVKNLKYHILKSTDAEKIAEEIESFSCQKAIAFSFWTTPLDWTCLEDAIIAEELEKRGIETYGHNIKSSLTFFDKAESRHFFEKNNFQCPKAVEVKHELFFKTGRDMTKNIYREAVLKEISKLNYPVVIKDTTGLSSFGLDRADSFKEASAILLSRKNRGDRLVEEYIQGEHFGCELYGKKGSWIFEEPLMFSLNRWGITSPKQSVKTGPVSNEKWKIEELKKELCRMADLLDMKGVLQADLIFNKEKGWYFTEINPRISGMTGTYAALEKKGIGQFVAEKLLFPEAKTENKGKILNFKFPLLSESEREKMKSLPYVRLVNQIENLEARQDRETGYAEVVLWGKDFSELKENLKKLSEEFPSKTENIFLEKAEKMFSLLS